MNFAIFVVTVALLAVTSAQKSDQKEKIQKKDQQIQPPAIAKSDRHLPQSSCSKLQYEIQKAILSNEWGLQNLKFQQRLKRHPKYIVTIQHIRSVHDPLIELRCPGSGTFSPHQHQQSSESLLGQGVSNRLEMYFHESRFSAESVRLFDINSIFPIHSGALSVKIKLDPLVIVMDKGSDIGLGIAQLYWRSLGRDEQSPGENASAYIELANKEHRENDDSLLDVEREIEEVFMRRIGPDVKRQIETIVRNTTAHFLNNNLVRFP